MYRNFELQSNHCRIRLSPDISFGIAMNNIAIRDESQSRAIEMVCGRHPQADEVDAYERVLGDAMAGDATLFAREDYVEEAWRNCRPCAPGWNARLRIRTQQLGDRLKWSEM
jgi:glucose-6-phosphate 1-dehydrogenase